MESQTTHSSPKRIYRIVLHFQQTAALLVLLFPRLALFHGLYPIIAIKMSTLAGHIKALKCVAATTDFCRNKTDCEASGTQVFCALAVINELLKGYAVM